jgi:hypothetical protein
MKPDILLINAVLAAIDEAPCAACTVASLADAFAGRRPATSVTK